MSSQPRPLRTWLAWSYLDAPIQGTTKPLFYQCYDREIAVRTGELVTETFLVKALSSEGTMAREIVGNRIAQVAGLRTPEPAIVFVSRSVAAQVDRARKASGRFSNQRPGRAAGALQFASSNVSSLSQVPRLLAEDALRLYVFDMLALHTDRTEQNPNCAITEDGLIVYDFERCFVEDDEDEPRMWPLWHGATHGLGPLHMFYTGLRRAKGVRQMARRVINAMTDSRLSVCLADLPAPWMPEGQRIVRHVKTVKEHADEFVEDVVRSLNS